MNRIVIQRPSPCTELRVINSTRQRGHRSASTNQLHVHLQDAIVVKPVDTTILVPHVDTASTSIRYKRIASLFMLMRQN